MLELLYTLAKNGELVHPDMVDPLPKVAVTGHDPCHLGRGMGVDVNTMHEAIVKALPNQTWMECPEHDRCCGAGGGVRASQKDLSYAILQRKVKRLTRTGADIVLAACPFCELQIDEGLRKVEACKMRAITPQAYIAMLFRDVYEEVDKL
jgi:Fe-S oxidoreductase